MNNTNEVYLNNMANHLLNNNLTLFIGAGFSRLFKYPSWGELLREIIDEFDLEKTLVETQLFPFITKDDYSKHTEVNDLILDKLLGVDYLRLAGYINHILKEEHDLTIHEAIRRKIQSCEDNRLVNSDTEKVKEFFLSNRQYLDDIITTNYDSNIEHCFDDEISMIHRDLSSLNNITFRNKVFKIHGCIKDESADIEDTIIITEKDYNNFISKNKYLFYKVYSFFTEKKIVFIGYSINDPNIRSVLNDVIEENDDKVTLEIYWVTWDKMKELDKKYYEEQFNLKIIEECQIVDFFEALQHRIDKNIKLRAVKEAEIEEYVNEYRRNYKDVAYVKDIKESKREEEVLKYLYDDLITKKSGSYLNAYFFLLTSVPSRISKKHKTQIQTLFQLEKSLNYDLIKLINRQKKVLQLINKLGLSEVLIENLLRFAYGHHSFGNYAASIECLLLAYSNFGEHLVDNEDFIRILAYNINSSTNRSRGDMGADWYGLGKVANYIDLLTEEDTLTLIEKLSGRGLDDLQGVRINTVIDNSCLEDEERYPLKYEYNYSKRVSSFIRRVIRRRLRKHSGKEGKISDTLYIINDYEVEFEIKEAKNKIEYLIRSKSDDIDLIMVSQEIVDESFKVCIYDECSTFVDFDEFYDDEDELEEKLELVIDEHFGEIDN